MVELGFAVQDLNAKPTFFFDEGLPGTGPDSLESLSVPLCLISRDIGSRVSVQRNKAVKFYLQLIEDRSVGLFLSWFQSVHTSQLNSVNFTM